MEKQDQGIVVEFIRFYQEYLNKEVVKELENLPAFQSVMDYKEQYGDLIFHDLVNIVAELSKYPIKDLLETFSLYYNSFQPTVTGNIGKKEMIPGFI